MAKAVWWSAIASDGDRAERKPGSGPEQPPASTTKTAIQARKREKMQNRLVQKNRKEMENNGEMKENEGIRWEHLVK